MEISKKNSPTGQRYTVKAYPKNDHYRALKIGAELTGLLTDRIAALGLQDDNLLFPSTPRNLQQPTSRNTFRTEVWRPAVLAARLPTTVRIHDLRHAHASWLLAGGADLKTVMDRLGHPDLHYPALHSMPSTAPTTPPFKPSCAPATDTSIFNWSRGRGRAGEGTTPGAGTA